MRFVIQRVNEASVSVGEKIVGKIGKGLFVLVGVQKGDTKDDADKLINKLSKLRVMADKEGKMNLNVMDAGGKILVVSQFTLYADTSRGNRPSFIKAGDPKEAEVIYKHVILGLKELNLKVETGSFGKYMQIGVELDGPVTILLES